MLMHIAKRSLSSFPMPDSRQPGWIRMNSIVGLAQQLQGVFYLNSVSRLS